MRLVESGQSQATGARSLGVGEQTVCNWESKHGSGSLRGAGSNAEVTAEEMENIGLRAELSRVAMESDMVRKATAYFAKVQK